MATDDRSEIQIRSRWGEIDSNGHMRNVAYLDISANSRMEFFNANGYTLTEFFGAGLGPRGGGIGLAGAVVAAFPADGQVIGAEGFKARIGE